MPLQAHLRATPGVPTKELRRQREIDKDVCMIPSPFQQPGAIGRHQPKPWWWCVAGVDPEHHVGVSARRSEQTLEGSRRNDVIRVREREPLSSSCRNRLVQGLGRIGFAEHSDAALERVVGAEYLGSLSVPSHQEDLGNNSTVEQALDAVVEVYRPATDGDDHRDQRARPPEALNSACPAHPSAAPPTR